MPRNKSKSLPPTQSTMTQQVVDYLQNVVSDPSTNNLKFRGLVIFFEKEQAKIYAAPGHTCRDDGPAWGKADNVPASKIVRVDTALSLIYKRPNNQVAAWLYSGGRHSQSLEKASFGMFAKKNKAKRKPAAKKKRLPG